MLEFLRTNKVAAEMLDDICDVDIFPQLKKPYDAEGRLTFSLSGQAFARDGAGSEYIIFEDGSVASMTTKASAAELLIHYRISLCLWLIALFGATISEKKLIAI